MPTDVNFNEVLITPLTNMVKELGQSVAQAQRELDEAALATQAQLAANHPELAEQGYQVTWYQIPEALVEMRMAIHLEKKTPQAMPKMYFAPFNTKYRNSMNFSADGSSTLKLKIVPVPPISRST